MNDEKGLRLDPEPWLCSDRYCTAPGLHRGTRVDFLRDEAIFKPREEYWQDQTRYDEEELARDMRGDKRAWHVALEDALDKVLPGFWTAAQDELLTSQDKNQNLPRTAQDEREALWRLIDKERRGWQRMGSGDSMELVDAILTARVSEREAVIAELRWLAEARRKYETDLFPSIVQEVKLANHLADILQRKTPVTEGGRGAGWIPSWLWDEWVQMARYEGNTDA